MATKKNQPARFVTGWVSSSGEVYTYGGPALDTLAQAEEDLMDMEDKEELVVMEITHRYRLDRSPTLKEIK